MKIGILGGAGYTGGELLRLLLNHPQAEIVFVNSESNAGNPVLDGVDVLFFCFGHGKSRQFLAEHSVPGNVKIIDLAQDFRLAAEGNDFVYGLPEINRSSIASAQHVANPGCFATCIQLGLLPAARMGLLTEDVSVNAITGSTGAGQKPGATTHFSWRAGNMSIYKPFTHQHVPEIRQSLTQLQGAPVGSIDFIPYRGPFARGIFATSVVRTRKPIEEIVEGYKAFYRDEPFTHYTDKPTHRHEAGGGHQQMPRSLREVRRQAAHNILHRQPAEGRRGAGRAEHEHHVWRGRGRRT